MHATELLPMACRSNSPYCSKVLASSCIVAILCFRVVTELSKRATDAVITQPEAHVNGVGVEFNLARQSDATANGFPLGRGRQKELGQETGLLR